MPSIRFLVIGLVALSLGLTGCGGQAPAKPAAQPQPAQQPTAPSQPASQQPAEKVKVIGLTQLVQHPSLDLVRKGILDQLKAEGFEEGKNIRIDFQNAQGDLALTKTIADKFVADKVDLIVTETTPSAQAAAKAVQNTKIPLVFTAVSDPLSAGLLKSVKEPSGTNITGLYNFDPVEAQFDLFQQIMPELKTVGVIFNPGESNSQANLKKLRDLVAKRNLKLVEAPVAASSEVQTAAQSLIGRVQAVYMPQDNTVVSAFEALVKVTREGKTPLFVSDGQSVRRGAIATVGNDDYRAGLQAGKMVARVLRGEEPGKIMPEQISARGVFINKKAAAAYGVKLPDAVVQNAQDVGE